MGHKINNKLGFTLIELIIVIAIIGILAAILIPRFSGYTEKANLAVCNENRVNLENMYQYLVADGAPGIGQVGAIGAANASRSFTNLKTYFETNSSDEFVFSSYICPKDGIISGELEDDGTKAGKLELSCTIHTNIFFQSAFNTMSQLKVLDSTYGWKVENGKLVPTVTRENRAIFNDSNGKDYTIKVNAKYFSETDAGYGIYYRATPGTPEKNISGYCFQYDPNFKIPDVFTVRKFTNGSTPTNPYITVNMMDVMPPGFIVAAPHDIEIKTEGTRQIIKVDGIVVLDFIDDTYKEGSVGLRTWSGTKFEVNEVIIEK